MIEPEKFAEQALYEEQLRLREELETKYDSPSDIRRDGLTDPRRGPRNFGSTLGLTFNRTRNPEAVKAIAETLGLLVDRTASGESAWEMRRFIRRATTPQIIEFAGVVNQLIEASPDFVGLNMDDFVWNFYEEHGEDDCNRELDTLRWNVDHLKRIHSQNPEAV